MAWLNASWMFWSAVALGSAAWLVFVWAFRGDRSRGRRRCPKCWYEMRGIAGLTCPECGRAARSERRLFRTRRRKRLMLVMFALMLLAGAVLARPLHRRIYIALNTGYRLVDEISVQGVTVKAYRYEFVGDDDWKQPKVEVWIGREKLLQLSDHHVMIGGGTGRGGQQIGRGASADGTGGNPDIVITLDSGGNRCCETVYILSVSKHPYDGRISVSIDDVIQPTGRGVWDDVDGDGVFEYLTDDPQFACGPWTCCASSPNAPIILEWTNTGYAPSSRLMPAPALSIAEVESLATDIAARPVSPTEPGVHLIQTAIPMIYRGNADAAERLVHLAWREDMIDSYWSTPDAMWAEFWSVIDAGPYGAFIRGLNAR